MKKRLFILLVPMLFTVVGCNQDEGEQFKTWNDCNSLTTLKEFVKDVTNKSSENYIPVEDRIATFDMDGTFIGELYPTYFEYNMLEYRALEDVNYKDICPADVKEVAQEIRDFVRNGTKLPDAFDMRHGKAAAKAYAGMTVKQFKDYVQEYAKKTPFGFKNMTYAESFYKPMIEVFDYLKANDFSYYVVSGSDRFICSALVESLGIDSSKVIGMDVELKSSSQAGDAVTYTMGSDEYLIRTENLLIKNLKTNKVKQIQQEIGKTPVLSFGNSSGDSAMHNFTKGNNKYRSEVFMVLADDEDEDHVNMVETNKRKASWEKNNYNIISMKDDWKTIYGENVEKVDFEFKPQALSEVEFEEFHEEAEKAPAHNFNTATLDCYDSIVSRDENYELINSSYNHYNLTAKLNSETGKWVIDTENLVHSSKSVFIDDNAAILDPYQTVVYNEEVIQNRDVHYYVGEGFRWRFTGNGHMTVGSGEINQKLVGTRVFNEFALINYYENQLEASSEAGTIVTIEKIFVSYSAE